MSNLVNCGNFHANPPISFLLLFLSPPPPPRSLLSSPTRPSPAPAYPLATAGCARHKTDAARGSGAGAATRPEEHTSELQSPYDLVCRLLLEKKKGDSKRSAAGISTVNSHAGNTLAS